MTLAADLRPAARRPQVTPTRRRSVWSRVDWLLVLAVAGLVGIGTLLVWSATLHRVDLTDGTSYAYGLRHLINAGIGAVLGIVVAATDHRWVRIWTPVVYALAIVGLGFVLVPGVGREINGSLSWIDVGGMSIQPAELAKLGVVVTMALLVAERFEGRKIGQSLRDRDVLAMLSIAAVPAVLIMLQPDLGTMLVLSATVFGVVAVAGAPKRWLALLVAGAVGSALAAVALGVLKPYQLDRFGAFVNPGLDPRGAGYNTTQARIAIGNGGLTGQGLFDGTQTQAGFVPEQHTDFVYTVAGEELGLVGAATIIGLYVLLLWRGLRIALGASDMFGRLAAAGIICWFGFQAFQNIGMCLGIMPVTGVPLPLVSYGGTSMFASVMAVGLLLNVHLRTDRPLGLGLGVVRSRVLRSRF
ncbi:MAG: rod shape-determining protein RodA [Propionibacteriales bacterium]|nr:rod shape-determining protein RodA [Propionibacteriales bacterium]